MTDTPKDLADAVATLATASKSLAEADKTRADTEKVRADLDAQRANAKIASDAAAADLMTKQLANEKSRADLAAARTDKLIEQLTGAVPDLGAITKNGVTFGDGRALRQSEAIGLAVAKIAREVSTDVAEALHHQGDDTDTTVFITAETSLVAAVAAYWQLVDEATHLTATLASAQSDATAALTPAGVDDIDVATTGFAGADVAMVGAAVAGKVISEVASLFEVDTAVTSSVSDIASLSVQAAVLQHLLKHHHLDLRHHWTRVPDPASPLRTAVSRLIASDIQAAETDALLAAAISALGDPAAARTKALKDAANEELSAEERELARDNTDRATAQIATLATLQTCRTRLTATVAKVKAFADRVSAPAADKVGPSALMAGYAIEPVSQADDNQWVLVIGPARAETFQMVVTRRLLSPRLHISTGVEVDYVLLHGARVRRAGHATSSAAYTAKLKGNKPDWSRPDALTS